MMSSRRNFLLCDDWDEISKSGCFEELLARVRQENHVVKGEMVQLLGVAKKKCGRLEKSRQSKVEWFLNEDAKQNINDTMLTYLCS